MNRVLCVLLFLFSLQANALTITNEGEVERAQEMSLAIDAISEKVMTCINSPNGSRQTCACKNLESCKYKADFEKVISLYCKIKVAYPAWANQTINYHIEGNKASNVLGMEGLGLQFGKYCK